jgi:hypothetical protein
MLRHFLTELIAGCILSLAVSASVFGQYGSGTGMGGTTSGGVYTTPKGGYKSSTGIAIGAAAAAGVVVAYLALRHRGVVGCIEQSGDGNKLMNEKDKNTYSLLASKDVALSPGERVALQGKKIKDDSGKLSFEATRVAKDYGSCQQ